MKKSPFFDVIRGKTSTCFIIQSDIYGLKCHQMLSNVSKSYTYKGFYSGFFRFFLGSGLLKGVKILGLCSRYPPRVGIKMPEGIAPRAVGDMLLHEPFLGFLDDIQSHLCLSTKECTIA